MHGIEAALIGLGLMFSAIAGVCYWFSDSFRSAKRDEWGKDLESKAIVEWGGWLLSILVVFALLAVVAVFALGATD